MLNVHKLSRWWFQRLLFSPLSLGKWIQFDERAYFSKGLVQPPTGCCGDVWQHKVTSRTKETINLRFVEGDILLFCHVKSSPWNHHQPFIFGCELLVSGRVQGIIKCHPFWRGKSIKRPNYGEFLGFPDFKFVHLFGLVIQSPLYFCDDFFFMF